MALSQTIIIGRLTRDPEVRNVNVRGEEKAVANFSVACDRDYGDATDFYDVVVWGRTAENVGKFLTKGREVAVIGRFQKRTYTAKLQDSGVEYPRDVWELHADRVQFLGSARDNGQAGGQQGGYQGEYQQQQGYQQPQGQSQGSYYENPPF